MSSLAVENIKSCGLDDHVAYLGKIVHLYLEEVRCRDDRNVVIRRLIRYCKMKDLSGLNNMLLNATSDEVKQMYEDFQKSDEMETPHLLDEFNAAICSSIADFS